MNSRGETEKMKQSLALGPRSIDQDEENSRDPRHDEQGSFSVFFREERPISVRKCETV